MPPARTTLLDEARARCARLAQWLAERRRTHTLWGPGPEPGQPQPSDPPKEPGEDPDSTERGRHP